MRIHQIISERTQQAMDLAALLNGNAFADFDELKKYLDEKYSIEPIGEGSFSIASADAGGRDYIIKWSRDSWNFSKDDWWRFAELAKKHHATNDLFPEILYSGIIGHHGRRIGVAILEYVNVGVGSVPTPWKIVELLRELKVVELDNAVRELMVAELDNTDFDDVDVNNKEVVKRIQAEIHEHILDYSNIAPEKFIEFMKIVGVDSAWDLHSGNYGSRKDGSIVIFDPTSWGD